MRSIAVGAFAALIAAQSVTPALAADPLKIGVLMQTSGVFAVLGQRQLKGMHFAIEEAGGEVAGRKIEMLHEDSEGKPDVGLAKTRKLVLSDRVDVMTGIINSAVALAVAPYLSSQRMPLVISNAAAELADAARSATATCSAFRIRARRSSEPIGLWMAKNAPEEPLHPRLRLRRARTNSSRPCQAGYLAGGGTIVGETYTPFGRTQDYGPYISQARSANPGAVFAVYFAAEALLFVKQYEFLRHEGEHSAVRPDRPDAARCCARRKATPRWASYRRRTTWSNSTRRRTARSAMPSRRNSARTPRSSRSWATTRCASSSRR